MNAEWTAVILTGCGIVATLINVFVALSIRGAIANLKLWATSTFVAKDDMSTYLSPLKDAVQMLYSQGRLSRWGMNK